MRSTRLFYSALLVLFLITFSTTSIIASPPDDETDEAEEYDVKARVVRISLISGVVTLKRKDSTEWETARLNMPLVEGDAISTDSTGGDARVEIQIDARNFVRLGPNSTLRIVTLRDEGVALSLVEGTASVRLAKFAADKESFEIDAPKTTLAVEKSGLYRIDVGKDGRVRLTARDGGRARIYSETSGFALRDGRAADLIIDGPDAGEWEMLIAARDPWDDWLDERERYLTQRLRYDTEYYDNDVWGAEDLDAYGAWVNTKDYGWIWRPHATVLSNYDNWAPYRYGQWTWVDPYGWTWIGNEPWGWAPYHFGRWVYYNNYWAWVPRSQYHRKRSWWRPALVAFVVNISLGDQICWYPLSYHHRDPRSRNYHRGDRDDRRDRRGHDDRDHRRRHPGHWGGVTGIPTRDFGGRNPRPRPANERDGRRVVSADPLPNVPVRPAREINRSATGANQDRPRRTWTRTDGSVPQPALPERRTGAAERNPGLPLDRELRRSRIWNGREARRQEFPVTTGRTGAVDTRPTGVVERPTRALREVDRDVNPRRDGDRGARGDRDVNRTSDRDDRVGRPNRASVPRSPESNEPQVPPSDTPVRSPANEERSPAERPARTEPYRRPAPVDRQERPERRERNEESPRHAPAERRSESPSASERSPQHERPMRAEPAPRAEPPPRNDPPPQRSEPERSEPQPRNDPRPPPDERSEPPPRNDPPPPPPVERSEPPPRNDPPPPPPVERSEPPPRNDPPPPPPVERSEPPPRNDPPPPPPVERSEPPRPNDPLPQPVEFLARSEGKRVRARRVPFTKTVYVS